MRVMIATGGTGGHIYPAISLANAIKKDSDKNEIVFIGTSNHMEAQLVPKAGFSFQSVEAKGFNGSIFSKADAFRILIKSYFKIQKVVQEFKPDIVIGFGGYVSAPVVLAAYKLGYPTLLHEQNSYAGKANRFLAKYADRIITCYSEVESQFPKDKVILLGNPRASEVHSIKGKSSIVQDLNLTESQPIVLIVMGSQGSESMNAIFLDILTQLKEKPYQTVYVTGKKHYQSYIEKIKPSAKVKIVEYVQTLDLYPYLSCIVSRGGATSAAEIAAIGLPSVIIPSPYVANNHQEINALAMAKNDACTMIKENEIIQNSDILIKAIDDIVLNSIKHESMHKAALDLGKPNAAQDTIQLMKTIIGE